MAQTGKLAAWVGREKGGFEIREYPVPDPAPGAAVIDVAVANVCGSDMHYWKGELDFAKRGRKLPINTGHEHMGTVAKLGAGVAVDSAGAPLREGDRVIYRYFIPCGRCGACLRRKFKSCPTRQSNCSVTCDVWPHFQGGYGQYFYLGPNHAIFKLPDAISDDMAAGVNCAFTQVYAALRFADFQMGQSVVIQGAGGLGVYAAGVAREMGASHVVVIDGVDERLALAREFGAHDTVDLRSFPTPQSRIEQVMKLTGGWGGDVVMELVGNPNVVDEGLRMTALEGTYLEVGNINVGWEATFDPAWILFGNRRIIGVAHYEAEHLKGALDLMLRTRDRYPYQKILSHHFPLERINDAFRQQEDGHITRGAIVPR
jgi:D-arabinose 1-dehydrogenase-like Zn-dependent alcohol dehydrogenase